MPQSTLGALKRPAGPALPAKSLSIKHEDLRSSPVTLIKKDKGCGSVVVTEEPGCKVQMLSREKPDRGDVVETFREGG